MKWYQKHICMCMRLFLRWMPSRHHVSKDVGMLSKEANILCKYRNITQECKLKSEIFVHVHASLFEMYAIIWSHVKRCRNVVKRGQCTGWRRLIGSRKLQIIFHKRATKYRSRLRKMTYKDKGSYGSSPPCIMKKIFSIFVPLFWHHII